MRSIRSIGTCLGAISLFLFAQTLISQELPSDEELFGDQVHESVMDLSSGDTVAFSEMLDMKELFGRALPGFEPRSLMDHAFLYGFLFAKTKMITNFAASLSSAESLTRLRTRMTPDFVAVLIRVGYDDDGLDFFEFIVDPQSGKIVDWYEFGLGRYVSENFRYLVVSTEGLPQSAVDSVPSFFDESTEHADDLAEIASAIRNGNPSGGIEAYRHAPNSFKSLDPALTLLIIAAAKSGNRERDYEYALEQVARFGSDNPRFAFMLIDYYFEREQYDEAIAAIEVIQDHLEMVEAGLEEMKASVFYARGDTDSAIRVYENVLRIEPDRVQTYLVLFSFYALNGQHASAQNMLDIINQRFDFGLGPEDLLNDPGFEGFVEWSRQRGE